MRLVENMHNRAKAFRLSGLCRMKGKASELAYCPAISLFALDYPDPKLSY